MNFTDLHELLRLEVLRRIESGDLTGTRLAQMTGFRQGHISNFLNSKRALSLEGLDRVLASQGISVDQMLPVELAAAGAKAPAPNDAIPESPVPEGPIVMVPLISASSAAEDGQVPAAAIFEVLPLATSRLADNRARPSRRSAGWQRFVALLVDTQQAAAMEPTLASGMIAVLDRHYNSLAPYRAHQPTLYAVRYGAGILLRYVEFDDGRLILRPLAIDCAVQLLSIGPDEMPSDYIVGRVCLLLNEL